MSVVFGFWSFVFIFYLNLHPKSQSRGEEDSHQNLLSSAILNISFASIKRHINYKKKSF